MYFQDIQKYISISRCTWSGNNLFF